MQTQIWLSLKIQPVYIKYREALAHFSTGAAISKSTLKKYYWANDPVSSINNFKGKETEEFKILKET